MGNKEKKEACKMTYITALSFKFMWDYCFSETYHGRQEKTCPVIFLFDKSRSSEAEFLSSENRPFNAQYPVIFSLPYIDGVLSQ